MKYLTYFKPHSYLKNKLSNLSKEYDLKLSSNLLIPLVFGEVNASKESDLIHTLSKINFKDLTLETKDFERDSNKLILNFNFSDEVYSLHKNTFEIFKDLSSNKKEFDYLSKRYFLTNYNPNLIISKAFKFNKLPLFSPNFEWSINSFYLSKKEKNDIKLVDEFKQHL